MMVFSVLGVVILLAGCIEPIDFEGFYESKEMKEYRVFNRIELENKTYDDEKLQPGNGRILDIKSDRYYVVEESYKVYEDEDDILDILINDDSVNNINPTDSGGSIWYVNKDGELSSVSTDISMVNAPDLEPPEKERLLEIKGLDNKFSKNNNQIINKTYKIWSPAPLIGSMTFYKLTAPPSPGDSGGTSATSNGTVSYTPAEPIEGFSFYLDLNTAITSGNTLAVLKITTAGAVIVSFNNKILVLDGEGTTEYLFIETKTNTVTSADEIVSFKSLKVIIAGAKPLRDLGFNLTPYATDNISPEFAGAITIDPMAIAGAKAAGTALDQVFTVTNAAANGLSEFEWKYGEYTFTGTNASITINFANLPAGAEGLETTGTHKIDVKARSGSGTAASPYMYWYGHVNIIINDP